MVSYTTVSPLPRLLEAVCFLWHCPAGHPGWVLPTTLPCGGRTFLDACAPRSPGRLVRVKGTAPRTEPAGPGSARRAGLGPQLVDDLRIGRTGASGDHGAAHGLRCLEDPGVAIALEDDLILDAIAPRARGELEPNQRPVALAVEGVDALQGGVGFGEDVIEGVGEGGCLAS